MIARAVLALMVGGVLLAGGCIETRRSLGEDCLKNDDCLSQVCSQLRCATSPPTLGRPEVADAAEPIVAEAGDESVGEGDAPWQDAPWDTGDGGD